MYWEPLRLTEALHTNWSPEDRLGIADRLGLRRHTGSRQTDSGLADRLEEAPQIYREPLRPIWTLSTNWGPTDWPGPRRLTGSHSDRQAISQPTGAPQNCWETLRPAGAPHTSWGAVDLLGVAQSDKQSLSPADPADLLGASQTTGASQTATEPGRRIGNR